MSNLCARIKRLETTHRAAGVTDAEMAEANRIARRHAQFMIREAMAGARLAWSPTGEASPWPPTEAERAEIEEIKERMSWVQDVRRRDWEAKNPGKSYDAYQEQRRAEARARVAQMQRDFAEAEAREDARLRANAEWEARRARETAASAVPQFDDREKALEDRKIRLDARTAAVAKAMADE